MIELSRHIEALLLKHDCVIVPGLGGFVTQYVPARRIEEEELFLPPYRSIGFNPDLAINDGLLAQSYMHAYDTTFPESVKLINDAVSKLKAELAQEGEYVLSGIGRLTLGMDGRYLFEPCEAGVISPELYGLDSVLLPLSASNGDAEVTAEEPTASTGKRKKSRKSLIKRTEKTYTISLNREFVNYVAAAVVALVFYFIWATPVGSSDGVAPQTASVLNSQLFDAVPQKAEQEATKIYENAVLQTAAAENADVYQAPAANASDKVQKPAPEESAEAASTVVANANSEKYTIVLASAIPQTNAEALVAKLSQQGIQGARVYKRGHMVRVVCGAYSSKDEAQLHLKRVSANSEFAQAWVMETK